MKRKRYTTIVMFIIFMLSFSICFEKVDAAFDLDSTTATYDSNTGWLIIYDNEFTDANSDYTQKFKSVLSKIKLGNVLINGISYFNDGFVKIVLTNSSKEEVNKQSDFLKTHTISKKLNLEYGAFIKSYTPPGGINVVLESSSNKKILDVNVKGLKPKMIVDSFTASKSKVENSGGNVSFYVNGDNLDIASFAIRNLRTNTTHDLDVSKTKASTSINIFENKSIKNRIDTFVLYINNVESNRKIDITVMPMPEQSNESNNSNNDTDTSDKNISNPNNNTSNSNENTDLPSHDSKDNNSVIVDNKTHSSIEGNESNNNVRTNDENQNKVSFDSHHKEVVKEKSNIIEDSKVESDNQILFDNKVIEGNSNDFTYIVLACLIVSAFIVGKILYNKHKQ